jgi:hypothetical protein
MRTHPQVERTVIRPSNGSRENEMRTRAIFVVLLVVGIVGPALGDDWKDKSGQGRWWRGEWKEEFWDGPCRVKLEAKRREFKREVKCKDGVGARWHGEWKEEFWDGPCQVKLEAKRDEYKEEVKCERAR